MDQYRRIFAMQMLVAGATFGSVEIAQAAKPQERKFPRALKAYKEIFEGGGLATGRLDAWYTLLTSDSTYSDPDIPKPVLTVSLKQHWKEVFDAFPDATYETVSLDPISERVWVYLWVMHATNTGTFNGVPATGRRVEMPGCEIVELRGGLIFRDVGYFDRLTFLTQLGYTLNNPPAPGTQPATSSPHS
jgi:steroid delta-isomerase-like uncharacterized protein